MRFNDSKRLECSVVAMMMLISSFAYCQDKKGTGSLKVMFYNVENLFDTSNDPLTEDDEFLPGGSMHWSNSKYNKKINSIAKVILAAGEGSPPAIVGFCEVENRHVLEDLVTKTPLSGLGYGIIHNDSPDPRGIDVCMIFRKDIVQINEYLSWIPSDIPKNEFHSRSILYVKCSVKGEPLVVIVNHWPSRRGGALAGEELRKDLAAMIRNKVDSIETLSSGKTKVVIVGDFNCTPGDPVMKILVSGRMKSGASLINLAENDESSKIGTYRYMGTWEILDQIIVTGNIMKSKSGVYCDTESFRIFSPDFLLKSDTYYPGPTTFSTYKGYRYQGGFSDHLPVLLNLGIR